MKKKVENSRLIELADSGLNWSQIGREVDCSPATISKRMKDLGYKSPYRSHVLSKEQIAKSVSLYQGGFSLEDVSRCFGVSRQSIYDLLKRRITLRKKERYGDENNFYRGGAKSDGAAHDLMEKAIALGMLIRPVVCSECGDIPHSAKDGRSLIHGHHEDYSKPLDVVWLCQKCHFERHKEIYGS